MQEKKRKLTEIKRKIDSPLAKYPFIHDLLIFMKFVNCFFENCFQIPDLSVMYSTFYSFSSYFLDFIEHT